MKLGRYESYRDSGVEWLGEVPEHWEVKSVKNIFKLIIEPAKKNNDFELLSVYTEIGVKPRKELAEKGNKASTTDGYWKVKKGDFIINKLLAWMGAVGLSEYDGVTSPAYDVLRSKVEINGKFFHEYFRTKTFSEEMKKNSRGIMEMRLRLYFEELGAIKLSIPPLSEQTKIAEYLDQKTVQIDQAIKQKEKLIELLKERRQILIHNAVTKGLNPNVKLKNSGIEWIGNIPEHWEVKKLKFVCKINPTTKYSPKIGKEENIEFVPMENINEEFGVIKHYDFRALKEINSGYTAFKNNDVIFAKITPCMENGNCVVVKNLKYDIGFGSTEFIVFRAIKGVSNSYIYSILRNKHFRIIFENNMRGSAGQKRISSDFLSNFEIAIPPIQEQQAIVEHIESNSAKIDHAISLERQQIEKLREYKATLIDSCVTGKVKVA
jgi:type I restriction enzyme, S subunit